MLYWQKDLRVQRKSCCREAETYRNEEHTQQWHSTNAARHNLANVQTAFTLGFVGIQMKESVGTLIRSLATCNVALR